MGITEPKYYESLFILLPKKTASPNSGSDFFHCRTCLIQQWILTKAQPVLKKDVIQTDLSGLSPEIKKQITLAPINYSLQNNSHALAQNVTITIRSDNLISATDLKFRRFRRPSFYLCRPTRIQSKHPVNPPGWICGLSNTRTPQIFASPSVNFQITHCLKPKPES